MKRGYFKVVGAFLILSMVTSASRGHTPGAGVLLISEGPCDLKAVWDVQVFVAEMTRFANLLEAVVAVQSGQPERDIRPYLRSEGAEKDKAKHARALTDRLGVVTAEISDIGIYLGLMNPILDELTKSNLKAARAQAEAGTALPGAVLSEITRQHDLRHALGILKSSILSLALSFSQNKSLSELLQSDLFIEGLKRVLRGSRTAAENALRTDGKYVLKPVPAVRVAEQLSGMLTSVFEPVYSGEDGTEEFRVDYDIISQDSEALLARNVMADEAGLVEVFSNLLANANRYAFVGMKGKKEFVVRFRSMSFGEEDQPITPNVRLLKPTEEGAYLEILFSDNGVGIPRDKLAQLGEYTTSGSGLGMRSVLKVLEAHKGGLDVVSQEGVGTTFTIYLPLVEKPEAPVDSGPKKAQSTFTVANAPEIILIDDGEDLIDSYGDLLAAKLPDHPSRTFLRGADAMKAIVPGKRQVIFLDRNIWKETFKANVAAITALSRPGAEKFIYGCSGDAAENAGDDPKLPGVTGWMVKPVEVDKMIAAAKKDLASPRVVPPGAGAVATEGATRKPEANAQSKLLGDDVLVVADETDTAESTAEMLTLALKGGKKVSSHRLGASAIRALVDGKPQIVFLDEAIPREKLKETVASILKASKPGSEKTVYVCSSRDRDDAGAHAEIPGISGWITWGSDPKVFIDAAKK